VPETLNVSLSGLSSVSFEITYQGGGAWDGEFSACGCTFSFLLTCGGGLWGIDITYVSGSFDCIDCETTETTITPECSPFEIAGTTFATTGSCPCGTGAWDFTITA
jgi:hypothetical protein